MTYPPESCKDNPYEVLTTTCKPVPLDGGTIGTVSFPPHTGGTTIYAQFHGTAIHPAQFSTYEAYRQCVDDNLAMYEAARAKVRQREQERYEQYMANRTRWQAVRDGIRDLQARYWWPEPLFMLVTWLTFIGMGVGAVLAIGAILPAIQRTALSFMLAFVLIGVVPMLCTVGVVMRVDTALGYPPEKVLPIIRFGGEQTEGGAE